MCNTERHQLTNEMKQTGFQAGFFPALIGINCERLQSTTRRLTFASSERFLLIVLMITTGAGDHCQVGNGLPGVWPGLLPGAWLACACLGPRGPLSPATCCRRAAPSTGPQAPGPQHAAWSCQFMKLMGKPTGTGILVQTWGSWRAEEEGRAAHLAGLALRLEGLSFLSLQGTRKDPTNAACCFLAV